MMDFKVSPPINNQDTKHDDDLLYDITGAQSIQDISETNSSFNTVFTEIEAPLSPVLTNSKKSLRHIARRKSRIKLMNRFSQSSFTSQESLQSQTFIPIKEEDTHNTEPIIDCCVPQNTEKHKSDDLEERMKRCLEIQRNKKFCYDIAKNVSNPPSKTIESCATDLKTIELPVDISKTFVSKTSVENKENDFNFKIPESPISGTKCKNKIEQKFEPNFETGSGKKINLSERALKRASKLFDDIIDLPYNSSIILSSMNSESEVNKINKTKSNQTEQNFSNINFKTASGNTLKLSETSLQKTKNLFDDIYELPPQKTNTSDHNLFDEKNDSSEHKIEFKIPDPPLDKNENVSPTKNLFSQITDTQMCWAAESAECIVDFGDSQWSPKNKSSPKKTQISVVKNKEDEDFFGNLTVCEDGTVMNSKHKTSPTKTQISVHKNKENEDFVSPEEENFFENLTVCENGTVMNSKHKTSPKKTQISVDKNKENEEFVSPEQENFFENLTVCENGTVMNSKHKTSPKKTQISVEKNKENEDFVSPEEENFFENLTVCEDGTVMSRNLSFEESEEETDKISEEFLQIFERKKEENKKLSDMKNVQFGFSTASGKNLEISEQELKKAQKMFEDINEHCNEENNKNMEFGFSTAAGTKIKISEQSLKKVENIFQDFDESTDTNFANPFKEDLVENSEEENNICGVFAAPEKNIQIEKSLNKVQNIFSGCGIDENVQENENSESSRNLEMSLLASGSVRSEFFTDNIDNSAEILNEQCPKYISLVPYNSSSSQNNEESSSSIEQDKNIKNEELDSCHGFTWDDALKSLKIHELYKKSFKLIEKDIKNNIFYPISFIFGDILRSIEYKNKNYKYSFRNRKKSGVIYSNKEKKKRKSNSQTSSQNLNISMTTRSKRKSTNEELFSDFIIIDKTSTRGRKRRSIDSLLNTSKTDEKNIPNNISINTDINIKKTIQNLEDEFLNSIENSLISSDEIKYEHKKVLENLILENESNICDNHSKISNTVLEEKDYINNFNNHKVISVSEETSKKVQYLFQDSNLNNESQNSINNFEENFNDFSVGFSTNLGKTVTITETAEQKIKKLLQDCEDSPKNVSSSGFATASGDKISISEDALKKAKNIFQGCEVTEEYLQKNNDKTNNTVNKVSTEDSLQKVKNIFEDEIPDLPKISSGFGFATASGKKVSISEDALKKAKNIFQDCEDTEKYFEENLETNKNNFFGTTSGKNVQISEATLKKTDIIQDCNIEDRLETHLSSFGFATASGKNVQISEESLKKVKNIFQDCYIEENLNIPISSDTSKSISSFGFASTSGKKVPVSEETLKKAKDCQEDNSSKNIDTPKNLDSSSFGFASASGKRVSISEEALKKAKNLFQDCDEDNLNKNINKSKNLDASNSISLFGFASASGKKVSISEEALKKANNLFQDCDEDNFNKNINTPKNLDASFEFASASGKKVSVSEEALKKAKNLFQDCDEDNFNKNINKPKNSDASNSITSFGFASASGKKVSISEEALKQAKNLFQDCDEDINTSKNTSSFGFTSASGNNISVSEEALKKAKTIFEDANNEINSSPQSSVENVSNKNVNISEETSNKVKNIFNEDILSKNEENIDEISNLKRKRCVSEHNTPNNVVLKPDSVQKLSAKKTNKSFSSPQTSSNDSTPILRNKNGRNLKKRSLGHGISSCKQINIEENSLKRAKLFFDDVDTPKKKETTINNNNLLNYSPVIKTPTVSKSAPNISSQSLLNSSVSMKETNQIIKLNLSQTKISPPKKICLDENPDSSAFQFRENTTGDVKKWTNDLQKELEMLKLKMSVIESRMMMMNKQQEIIESGSSDHRRQRPGHLFTQKLNNHSRISLKEIVNNRRPQKNTHQICLNMGLNSSLLNITPENSSSLHFHVPWWINDNRTYPAVIRTEDGALIIPNQQNFFGVTEIEHAFLAMPGVDPSLVMKKWVGNHYRWIVWKLASMERNYPDVFKDYLSVENVMGQLKYRYDREIDRAQRPVIRKIVECDDAPAKRMVLCVASIIKTENQHELELTDGWYSIRTLIDLPLNSLVEKQVIRIGMKLMTQGAELLNCEGCCPLELPSNVRLQIHYNSTRRAAWHLKLGSYPHPGPLRISLRMISNSGGPIGGVIAYIARVYPISFMERGDESTTWRNERAEMRRANQWEAEYTNTIESVQAKVEEEMEKEWREREKRKGKLKIKDVRGVQCGKTLYQFLEESVDPDSVKEILTSAQILYLQEYQAQLNIEHQSEISSKVRERLSKEKNQPRNVSTVLKLLLVDVQSPYHSRMMSIWRPTELHSQILKEGIIVNIYNVTAKNNGTLSSIPRTQFEENSDYDPGRYVTLNRVVTPIIQTSNPEFKAQFGEYDTVGMVVFVDVQQTTQTLWLADENQRFLKIVLRESPNACTLFDGLTPGKIVSVMNLIHKKPFKSYGEAIGNHYTVVSSYPQQTYLQQHMQEFIENLPQDVDRYLEECQNIVEGFSSNNFSLNSYINCSENERETFCKKLLGLENSQQNKPDPLTLSDEEMALLDTQQY